MQECYCTFGKLTRLLLMYATGKQLRYTTHVDYEQTYRSWKRVISVTGFLKSTSDIST